jgi:thiol-disulfide isomerase/thioredoxin
MKSGMNLQKRGVLVVLLTLLLSIAQPLQAAVKMPAFSLKDPVTGKIVDSQEFEGKALFVTFFATWCPPCMQEIPTLKKVQKEFGTQGFSVLGLSVDQEGPQVVSKLIKKRSINYPVLMADSKTTRRFGGVYGIPVSFLVNKKGNVVKKYTGYVAHSILIRDLKKVLK